MHSHSASIPFSDQAVLDALQHGDGAGVKIAILDSGVETSHPDLAGLVLEDDIVVQEDCGRLHLDDGHGVDVFGHGTAIASLIRRHAPAARIGSFRVLSPSLATRNHQIRAGVLAAIERGYHIINCSFGSRDDQGRHAMLFKEWLDKAYIARVHVVAACNNDDFNIQEWPGFFTSCITVNMAAADGPNLVYRRDHIVEFAAPGDGRRVPWVGGTHKTVCGSSFAVPVVSSYLARLLSRFPDLSIAQAKAMLQRHSQPWRDEFACGNTMPGQPVVD